MTCSLEVSRGIFLPDHDNSRLTLRELLRVIRLDDNVKLFLCIDVCRSMKRMHDDGLVYGGCTISTRDIEVRRFNDMIGGSVMARSCTRFALSEKDFVSDVNCMITFILRMFILESFDYECDHHLTERDLANLRISALCKTPWLMGLSEITGDKLMRVESVLQVLTQGINPELIGNAALTTANYDKCGEYDSSDDGVVILNIMYDRLNVFAVEMCLRCFFLILATTGYRRRVAGPAAIYITHLCYAETNLPRMSDEQMRCVNQFIADNRIRALLPQMCYGDRMDQFISAFECIHVVSNPGTDVSRDATMTRRFKLRTSLPSNPRMFEAAKNKLRLYTSRLKLDPEAREWYESFTCIT